MMIFEYIKRMLKYAPATNRRIETKSDSTITTATGIYFGGQPQPSITFSSSNTVCKTTPPAIDQLVATVANKIDEKSMSDYEFREWLRDNLSSCEYQSENGSRKYVKADDARPISVIDAMIEVN